jgi:aspartyl-tRNA(Asn)/glutamyl-tRNA(Gln) amidotransferase subunit A
MATNLAFLTIAAAAELIKSHQLSPVEYVEALITRTETFDPQLRAYITPTFDLARQQAKRAESEIMAGTYRGPMHGIPFALKDIYDTKGIRTSGHSKVCLNRIPEMDATTTSALYEAGAILMGKLATHEFAHGGPSFDLPWPPARNPWHLAHFTGGSSSGSGAAVAAGLVPMALGSDTGGSIRGPASLCGVAGLMPTFGLVSRGGVIPNSFTFDHCGPLARSVEDCALVLPTIAGFDPRDAGSLQRDLPDYRAALKQDLKGLRIGVLRHAWEEDLPASDDVRRAMDAALDVLKHLGAELEDCCVQSLQSYFDVKVIMAETEIFSIHQPALIVRPGDFGADFRARVLPAALFTANDYVQATREHRRMVVEMAPLYRQYDAFITAGQGEAPPLEAHRSLTFWQRPNLFTAANVTSQPTLELCNGFGTRGLPLGMQILGRPFDEATVLRIGHAYEQAAGWHRQHPQMHADTQAPTLTPPPILAGTAHQADSATREACVQAAQRAGLTLNDEQFAQLLEGAPYALAMARRLRRDHGYANEPANVFSFPASFHRLPAQAS